MNKMIVTVFNDESSAYKGVNALKQLHAEGSLTLYATAVIAKDAKGAVGIKQAADQGPLGTRLGCATGSLIKKVKREKIELPKRSKKGEYDDVKPMKNRRFIPQKY